MPTTQLIDLAKKTLDHSKEIRREELVRTIYILNLYKKSVKFVKNRIFAVSKDNSFNEHVLLIVKVLDNYNLSLLLAEGYEKRIWNDLMDRKPSMGEFLIEETIIYFKNIISCERDFEDMAQHIGYSQSILNTENTAMDKNITTSMPKCNTAVQILKDNPWLLYLTLIIDAFN